MDKHTEKPKAPCMNCKERHEACHDTCEKYREYRVKQDIFNKVVRKAKTKYWGDDFE